MKFLAQSTFETCIPSLITKFQQQLENISDIIPFDKMYDEDTLSGCYEKLDMIERRIQEITEQYKIDNYALQQFIIAKQEAEEEIEKLLLQRASKYAKWKKEVMQIGEETIRISNQIKELRSIEREFNALFRKKYNKGALAVVMFHNMVNTLLHLSSYNKENTPLGSFMNAFTKGLIDINVYKKLCKLT